MGFRGKGEHTSFSPTATSKFLPRGMTCAISPKATVSLLPLTNLTLNPSITSGLLPVVCLNLANSALSDSRIRSIAASKAEKSSGSTGRRTMLLVGPFPPLFSVAVVEWADNNNLSFFLLSRVDELRGTRAEGYQWWTTGPDGERKGGGGRRKRRRRHIIEGWRGRMPVIRVLAGWEVSIVGGCLGIV